MHRGKVGKAGVMVQRRGRPLRGFGDGSGSSSDDSGDDAFTNRIKKKARAAPPPDAPPPNAPPAAEAPSRNKRHHHASSARQAKMDALLQELRTTKPSDPSAARGEDYGSIQDGDGFYGRSEFAPHKKGSYVEPGMEHLTTNLFVGNLDPMTTEEELTDAFRQFGDLYSVKIMWPRTAEERARNRNTGFVCFMHRTDAEDAMDAYCDADPLGTGRRMLLRWGKNVKKTVKFGTGGVPTNLRKKPRDDRAARRDSDRDNDVRGGSSAGGSCRSPERESTEPHPSRGQSSDRKVISSALSAAPLPGQNVESKSKEKTMQSLGPVYDPAQHSAEAIIVTAPSDPRRLKFITIIASFVAKDGSVLEQKLIETQSFNHEFQFLTPRDDGAIPMSGADENDECFEEHIFYRWRVYSFAHGDGLNSWRTDPFVMFEPHGRFWIPPQLNTVAAQEEEEAEKRREHDILAAQEERRRLAGEKRDCVTTGAQMRRTGLDKGGGGATGGIRLNEWERRVFRELLREKLCASRESICETMAFAFDKSGAAKEISELLREALLESEGGVSVDTRIARLFLLSDILFNSQQPGVRNAFQYRDAIEEMAPEVFESLGKHGCGRMTKNKLRKAVSSVLSAWTNWSVYNSTFMDELECKFEGREIPSVVKENQDGQETEDLGTDGDDDAEEDVAVIEKNPAPVSATPRGMWTSTTSIHVQSSEKDIDGEAIDDLDGDGELLDDLDGQSLDESEERAIDDVDGEELADTDDGSFEGGV